ncbi:MgtC/SapB family protein [Actinomadura yumaensis]|uniref:MgtC/SapB family protein n=1 Tax=Actinomadura yumaensis TaxID=111807 RepID=UPI00360944D3
MIDLSPGQGWTQLGELLLALVLSAAIGLERGLRNKSAGLRTHTLVGVGAALFMLVSKYGFDNVPGQNVAFDPSRVAAQIVSGIGFIGGGLIFVRRDAVRGLTTAAVVWVTAAVGMAAGGGLPVLAVAVTAGHFLVVYGLSWLARSLPLGRFRRPDTHRVRLVYRDGRGALRRTLMECTGRGSWSPRSPSSASTSRTTPTSAATSAATGTSGPAAGAATRWSRWCWRAPARSPTSPAC